MIPLALGLALMAMGTAAQNKQTRNANNRRMTEMRTGRNKEKVVQGEQRSDVLGTAEKFDPTVRQQLLDSTAKDTQDRISAVLGDNALLTTGDAGVLPDKLLAQRAASTREKANTASILATLMSKVQAPGQAAVTENQNITDLNNRSGTRVSNLDRIGRTTNTLADLEGRTNARDMMLAGLMQQGGMSLASGQILGALAAPGAGVAATGGAGAGVPNMSMDPNYAPVDWFKGVR